VVRFLKAGDKVKVTIMFRGREQSRPELGYRLLRRLESEISELGYVEAAPKQDGRNMIMVLAPHRATKAAAVAANTKAPSAREQRADENEAAEAASTATTVGPAGNSGE
jgi:translation initiation factor IF-3